MQDVRKTMYPDGTSLVESIVIDVTMTDKIPCWLRREFYDEAGNWIEYEDEWKGYASVGGYLNLCAKIEVEPRWDVVKDAWKKSLAYEHNPMAKKMKE